MIRAITEPLERKSSKSFECSNCGATLVYGVDSEKLDCDYCESAHTLSEVLETCAEALTEQALHELFCSSKKQAISLNQVLECEQC